jgi:hypothetical protein
MGLVVIMGATRIISRGGGYSQNIFLLITLEQHFPNWWVAKSF